MAGAGYRDVANPSIVAAIQFERQPTASGASSGGNIVFRTGFNGTNSHTGVSEQMRLTYGGNLSIGNSHAVKKIHISTAGNQKILIDPNYNNNSGGSSNSEANAGNIVESVLIRTSFGDNAASQTNADINGESNSKDIMVMILLKQHQNVQEFCSIRRRSRRL